MLQNTSEEKTIYGNKLFAVFSTNKHCACVNSVGDAYKKKRKKIFR